MSKNTTTVEKFKASFKALKDAFDAIKTEGPEQKFFNVQTSDGKTLNVNDEDGNGVPSIGDTVTEGDKPAPDGEYQITDGSTFTVVSGAITAVSQPEPIDMAAKMAEVITMATKTFDAFKKETNDRIEKFEASVKTVTEAHEATNAELKLAKETIEAQKKLIDNTFEVVKLLSELPAEVENPDPTQKQKMANEIKSKKKAAFERLVADRQAIGKK